MKSIKTLGIVLSAFLSMATPLSANMSLVGGVTQAHIGDNTTAKTGYGGGILFEVGGTVGLEVGALMMQRKFSGAATLNGMQVGIDYKMNTLQVPAVIRVHFVPVLSFGLGGYYAMGLGNVDVTTTVNGASSTVSYSYGDDVKKTDYGALVSGRIDIPMGLTAGLVLDARYLHGLADNGGDKFREIQGLIGLRFGMMK